MGHKEISVKDDHFDRDSNSKVKNGSKICRNMDSSKRELWGGGTY